MTIPAKWWELDETLMSAMHLAEYTVSEAPEVSPNCRGFMVDADGTLVVDGIEDGISITLTVLAGIVYPIGLSKIYSSGSGPTTVIALY